MRGMIGLPQYEVYAIRLATVERRAADNFMVRDVHDVHDGVMPLDFFMWLIRGENRLVVVDTGFSDYSATKRNRERMISSAEAVHALGASVDDVQDVIITHLHYDHAGELGSFPAARLHVQDAEVAFATGRYMCHPQLNHFFEVEDVLQLIREVYAGRVDFHKGDEELAPGLSIHRVGGHTDGLQVVRVHTRRGWVVLASDALHYYANLDRRNPFPAIFNVGDMLEGYRMIERLADSSAHIIPGHDPLVRERYPRLPVDGVEIAVLHEEPRQ